MIKQEVNNENLEISFTEEQYECKSCHNQFDDILLMKCGHNLCISCAAIIMFQDIIRNSELSNVFNKLDANLLSL